MKVWLCQALGDGRPSCPDKDEQQINVDTLPCLSKTYPQLRNNITCEGHSDYCVEEVGHIGLNHAILALSLCLLALAFFYIYTAGCNPECGKILCKHGRCCLTIWSCFIFLSAATAIIISAFIISKGTGHGISDVTCKGHSVIKRENDTNECATQYFCNGQELTKANEEFEKFRFFTFLAEAFLFFVFLVVMFLSTDTTTGSNTESVGHRENEGVITEEQDAQIVAVEIE